MRKEPEAVPLSEILHSEPKENKPVKVTHGYIAKRTAADMRKIVEFTETAAKEVEAGDMEAFYGWITEDLDKWREMALLRFAYLQEHKGKTIDMPVEKEKEDENQPPDGG